MSPLPVLDHDAVLAAVSPAQAIDHVRDAFLRYDAGEWSMPAKIYLPSPQPDDPRAAHEGEAGRRAGGRRGGDFRAMPALGDGLALLKWVTSFPANPQRGLPTVMGVICLSDAETGAPLMLLDARSVTALRTGAAAVAARALAALSREIGLREGTREQAVGCDVVCCVTPGAEVVIDAADLRPGLHLNMLGADGPGKAEATVGAVASCALFCDEWAQAAHGGELAGAVRDGMVSRETVTELGAVLAGRAAGRPGAAAVTLFDSTGLAIQDLAIARAAYTAWRDGAPVAQTVSL